MMPGASSAPECRVSFANYHSRDGWSGIHLYAARTTIATY
jgi:hypothetical protein